MTITCVDSVSGDGTWQVLQKPWLRRLDVRDGVNALRLLAFKHRSQRDDTV